MARPVLRRRTQLLPAGTDRARGRPARVVQAQRPAPAPHRRPGWRIETPSRPELAKLASETSTSRKAGGHLSLADFRRLQDYAADRFVTVVPEIDLPGHTNAATSVYGELRADGQPTAPYEGIEVGFSQLTYDLPATEPFLRDILADIAAITDGEYIHVGGDEALTLGAEGMRVSSRCSRRSWSARERRSSPGRRPPRRGPDPTPSFSTGTTASTARRSWLRPRGLPLHHVPGNRAYLDMKYTAEYPSARSGRPHRAPHGVRLGPCRGHRGPAG
ncbi:family 20 glycosylhydrolase [Oerskovia sp. M15]